MYACVHLCVCEGGTVCLLVLSLVTPSSPSLSICCRFQTKYLPLARRPRSIRSSLVSSSAEDMQDTEGATGVARDGVGVGGTFNQSLSANLDLFQFILPLLLCRVAQLIGEDLAEAILDHFWSPLIPRCSSAPRSPEDCYRVAICEANNSLNCKNSGRFTDPV